MKSGASSLGTHVLLEAVSITAMPVTKTSAYSVAGECRRESQAPWLIWPSLKNRDVALSVAELVDRRRSSMASNPTKTSGS